MQEIKNIASEITTNNVVSCLKRIFYECDFISIIKKNKEQETKFLDALLDALSKVQIKSIEHVSVFIKTLHEPFVEQKTGGNIYNSYPYYIYEEKPSFKEAYLINFDESINYIVNHLLFTPDFGPVISFYKYRNNRKFLAFKIVGKDYFENLTNSFKRTYLNWLKENGVKVYKVNKRISSQNWSGNSVRKSILEVEKNN